MMHICTRMPLLFEGSVFSSVILRIFKTIKVSPLNVLKDLRQPKIIKKVMSKRIPVRSEKENGTP